MYNSKKRMGAVISALVLALIMALSTVAVAAEGLTPSAFPTNVQEYYLDGIDYNSDTEVFLDGVQVEVLEVATEALDDRLLALERNRSFGAWDASTLLENVNMEMQAVDSHIALEELEAVFLEFSNSMHTRA